jgi:hypothetical protein
MNRMNNFNGIECDFDPDLIYIVYRLLLFITWTSCYVEGKLYKWPSFGNPRMSLSRVNCMAIDFFILFYLFIYLFILFLVTISTILE